MKKGELMIKPHYPWWSYIKSIIRAYPDREEKELVGVAKREYEAVQAAIEATERMESAAVRLKIIQFAHFDRTHTLEGAALMVPCSRSWAAKLQRDFFKEVARNRDLLD